MWIPYGSMLVWGIAVFLALMAAWQHGYQTSRKHLAKDADLPVKDRADRAFFFISGAKYWVEKDE